MSSLKTKGKNILQAKFNYMQSAMNPWKQDNSMNDGQHKPARIYKTANSTAPPVCAPPTVKRDTKILLGLSKLKLVLVKIEKKIICVCLLSNSLTPESSNSS